MFQSLRQQRAMSPTQETPRAIPAIKLTSATPVASSTPSSLAPRKGDSAPRRVVPKRTLVLHEAPPPLPLPKAKVLPVKDHSNAEFRPAAKVARPFASTNGKIKVFVDPPQDIEATPKLVQKKKSRAALDSIKWALGDRTNGPKDSTTKADKKKPKEKEGRASLDVPSDKEKSDKEKWKWTLGRGRKDSTKDGKEKPGRDCEYTLRSCFCILLTIAPSASARLSAREHQTTRSSHVLHIYRVHIEQGRFSCTP